jgi:dolichol-phosphate mannosyltransferase
VALAAASTRRIGILLAPLIDVLAFCAFLSAGGSLRASNTYAFLIGYAFTLLLRWDDLRALEQPPWSPPRLLTRSVVAGLMALFLRAGVLALLVQRWGWTPQAAIFLAVAVGLSVTAPRWRNLAVAVVAYGFVLRLVYAGSVEMMPEETYYWNYSRHLDFGYLDHPPMVAWAIRAGTAIFGQSEFGVRAGALCCGVVTSIFIYKLARNLYGRPAALAALLLAQALPFFFLSGLLMTPDAILTSAWVASLYFLERVLLGGQSRAWWYLGLSLGIGMISKYSIALLGLVAAAFMIWDPPSRRWWRRPEPYVAAVIASLIFLPVIIWNAQHDWASFAFQTSRRLAEKPQFALHKLIGSIIVLITPTGVLAAFEVIFSRGQGDPHGIRQRRLFGLGLIIPLSVFTVFSLRHEVKLDWTGPSWAAILPAMGFAMTSREAHAQGIAKWIRAAWTPTILVFVLFYGALLHYLVLGLPWIGYDKHIEAIPVGWRSLSAHIIDTANQYRQETGDDALIVGMDRYAIASELAFYGGIRRPPGLETANSFLFGGMGLMYGQWMPAKAQEGRSLLLIAWTRAELEDPAIGARVDRLGPIEDDLLIRDGVLIRHYYHRFAFNYRFPAGEQMP